MTYRSNETCQIRYGFNPERETGLVVHEGTGRPRCGQPVRPWHGQEMVLRDLGPGQVTCGNCARCAQ